MKMRLYNKNPYKRRTFDMYLFAFRSRTQTMKLFDLLRSNGIECEIINTPREVSASCGLSVSTQPDALQRALDIYKYYHPDTLIGVFYYDGQGYRRYS